VRRSGAFAAVALVFGLAYALITPPFEVPDEVGHYWRASSIAYGFVSNALPMMPRGFGVIVYALWTPDRTRHMTSDRLRLARGVMLEPQVRGPVRAHSFYSPAAYVPQILAALIARMASIRPFFGFYIGRFLTLLVSVLVLSVAGVVAPGFRDHVHAVSLLPMSLFLFGSWSADAMTISAACLVSSLIVAGFDGDVRMKSIIAASFWLSLCKPSYSLLSLLALLMPLRRRRDAILLLFAVVFGSILSIWITTSTAIGLPRPDLPVDSRAQLHFIRDSPARFVEILVNDLRRNGFDYLLAMTGRFGLYDVFAPGVVSMLLLLMLAVIGLMNGPSLPLRVRITICAVTAMVFVGILAYLYITSSIAGGTTIEGTQGRYILPVFPLALCVLRIPRLRVSFPYGAILAATGLANSVCIAVLVHRYW
jgi:uncharacterized membrane protein